MTIRDVRTAWRQARAGCAGNMSAVHTSINSRRGQKLSVAANATSLNVCLRVEWILGGEGGPSGAGQGGFPAFPAHGVTDARSRVEKSK